MSPLLPAGHFLDQLAALTSQADALRDAASWLEMGYIGGVGTVWVTPAGAVMVHIEPAGLPAAPPVRLRTLRHALPAAELEYGLPVRLHSGDWGQQVRLRIPVPGLMDLTLWCYERIADPRLARA